MARTNKTQYAILGMLNYQPMSGYDIKKISDHSIGHFWNENYGNIYPVLKRMMREGLVTMDIQQGGSAPPRKVYTITAKGRQFFLDWLAGSPERQILREELLLQLFFGQWISPNIIEDKLHNESAFCSAMIKNLQQIKAHLEEDHGKNLPEQSVGTFAAGRPYWKMTVEFGLRYYQGIREWCDASLHELSQIDKGEKR
ncbi:PadR family transcriptional regulator [Sediminispirochaeta smaragdinae]|uniref:Transcriptional regulator, PadR-like family n=1 Tax=Sediminispirochaeta smaragdinae (strain DSM 11293 / JCM 15392 / SEBR 4228) TaxID=573413 RepID=E1RAF7_SEDSS|nr:PadR family transcriptional regulator [Sediminispirochaeta smaragdinae]ADK79448.1 transcriptional regulator, PadR-like family [Sediminispirochaeta smaragdinae DSM 11293]